MTFATSRSAPTCSGSHAYSAREVRCRDQKQRRLVTHQARRCAAISLSAGTPTFVGTAAVLAVLLQRSIVPAVQQIAVDPTRLSFTGMLALIVTLLLATIGAASAAFVACQFGRLLAIHRYMANAHTALAAHLSQTAPLLEYGFSERGLSFAANGEPHAEGTRPVASMLPHSRATLILGDHGSGRSTVLRECALALTRRRTLWRIALGYAPLPILVSLPEYALEASSGMQLLDFVAEQLSRGGAPVLGKRLQRSLGHAHILLLCDDLHEVPADRTASLVDELAAFTSNHFLRVRAAVTCDLAEYTAEFARLAGLRHFNRIVVRGLTTQDLSTVLRRAARMRALGGRTGPAAEVALTRAALGAQLTHPATLKSALAVLGTSEPIPRGRCRLLMKYVSHSVLSVVGDDIAMERALAILGQTAGLLRWRAQAIISVHPSQSPGDALAAFLASECLPHAAAGSGRVSAEDATMAANAALASGIFEWLPDGRALRFAAYSVESALAALWRVLTMPVIDGSLRTAREPGWWEPHIIGAVIAADAVERNATHRAPPAAEVSETTSLMALSADDDFVSLTLALASALEVHAPTRSGDQSESPTTAIGGESATNLQTDLDRVASTVRSAEQRARFGDLLAAVERETQVDITGHLATLATTRATQRLIRAQAATILAALPSPRAAQAVVELITDRDPVIRHALDQAMACASPDVYAAVNDCIAEGDVFARHRAAELMTRGGHAAAEQAERNLANPNPRLRAAAARTLGMLHHANAKDAIEGLLPDPDSAVRVAATRALGLMGDASVTPKLAAQLPCADVEQRVAIAASLGDLRDASSVATLTALLRDVDNEVRSAAAAALGTIRDERAARALRAQRSDGNPVVQAAVSTALRRLTAV